MFNHAELFEAVAGAVPERPAFVFRRRTYTYGEIDDRVRRLANLLLDHGVTIRRERSELAPWESGQDHVGLYLYNSPEYLEGMLGACLARAVSFNINYRYVEGELLYLLEDAAPRALIYHATFAPLLDAVVSRLPERPLLLQVDDGSGVPLLDGALDYEAALAAASPARPDIELSPDDLYMLYTGGTTGMPKGTLWTQADMYAAALNFVPDVDSTSPATIAASVSKLTPAVALALPPMMHGGAQWIALGNLLGGGTVAIQDEVTKLDARDAWATIEREGVATMTIIGDAFARPLCDELERGDYDAGSLRFIINGGAILSSGVKQRLLDLLPDVLILDVAGSSETGSQLQAVSAGDKAAGQGVFNLVPGTCVVDEAMTTVLEPGHDGIGWLAKRKPIPLGYLGDREKTEKTFRLVAGERMALPGDRARLREDGRVELLGRDSVTINSGGEKIFAEEVEQALVAHDAVVDVVVVGRPSERWGQEVVAVVQLRQGSAVSDDDLLATANERIARYKLPKAIVRVDQVLRSPNGKADYRWAKSIVTPEV